MPDRLLLPADPALWGERPVREHPVLVDDLAERHGECPSKQHRLITAYLRKRMLEKMETA